MADPAVHRSRASCRVHSHALVLDGVYVHEGDDPQALLEFRERDHHSEHRFATHPRRATERRDSQPRWVLAVQAANRRLSPETRAWPPMKVAQNEDSRQRWLYVARANNALDRVRLR